MKKVFLLHKAKTNFLIRKEAWIIKDFKNNKQLSLKQRLEKLNISHACIDLMMNLLTFDPDKRLTAK